MSNVKAVVLGGVAVVAGVTAVTLAYKRFTKPTKEKLAKRAQATLNDLEKKIETAPEEERKILDISIEIVRQQLELLTNTEIELSTSTLEATETILKRMNKS